MSRRAFAIEQVAAEPLVADPVAIAFDENARLYVVEMRGYSENKDEKVSRIRLLEDTNGDGQVRQEHGFCRWAGLADGHFLLGGRRDRGRCAGHPLLQRHRRRRQGGRAADALHGPGHRATCRAW